MVKALVVDDSRAVRMILARTLQQLGYQVLQAANGREAMDVVAVEKSAIRLVLADWNMPLVNGMELLKWLRQNPELDSVAIVMVTTETELDHMAQALEARANEYVMKPFTTDILLDKLRMVGVHA